MFVITPENFKRQQLILKHLNFYHGDCDGVWGRTSIAAMQKFESNPAFKPAYPSNGMPLDPNGKLPKGIIRDPNDRNMLTHIELTEERIAVLLAPKVLKPREVEPKVVEQESVAEETATKETEVEKTEESKTPEQLRHERKNKHKQRHR